MIKEINNIKFTYKGIQEIDEKLKEKINNNWNEITKDSDFLHEGEILNVTAINEENNIFEVELKSTTFSHYMYSKISNETNVNPMFSGAYILTADGYVVCCAEKYFENNEYYEIINLVGGTSDVKDIKNGAYSCEDNLIREYKEETGIDITDKHFTLKLKYLKYPSEEENKQAYPIGTIYEIKAKYTKDELDRMFNLNKHDNELGKLIFFNKDNYKEIYNYKNKKKYIPEVWERIFS